MDATYSGYKISGNDCIEENEEFDTSTEIKCLVSGVCSY